MTPAERQPEGLPKQPQASNADDSPVPGALNLDNPGGNLLLSDREDLARYPVALSTTPFAMPSFTGSNAGYGYAQQALTQVAQHGTNYAGHYAIAEISCGMQCKTNMVIDGQTGRIVDFPLSGQDYRNLDLTYRPDSSLVKAEWETDDVDMCGHAQFVFDGTVFHRLPGDSQSSRCSTS